MVLGQNRTVLVASVICFQKIYGLQSVNHQIIQYLEKEKVMTDRQTNRQNFLSKTRPLPYIDLLNLRFGGAPSSLVLERLSTEQAHFLLFTKLSHLIFARTGSTRLGTVHQCCA